jgi:protein-L-isoaspartate O-methyltransferase
MNIPRKLSNFFWFLIDQFSCKLDKFATYYEEKSIGTEYTREYTTFDISKQKKILHIGCGSYPLTELTLAKITNAQLVGIDKNPQAVALAKEVIHKKKLGKKIHIMLGNGVDFAVDSFNVIIVSSCCTPKVQVLKHIFQNAKSGSMIIVRELDIAVPPIITCIKKHKNISLLQRTKHYPFPFRDPFGWQSFFIQKN